MGKNIDYRIRTAKYIERRMFLDLFTKLNAFDNIENYRYIGFGSIYFTDFILFHKYLNITDMVSIEKKAIQKERYLFNKPYSFIKVLFGECQDKLEEAFGNEKRRIVWLDFDSFFDIKSVLDSINEVISLSGSGEMLLFSFNVDRTMKDEEINKFKQVLSGYLSIELKDVDFQKANLPKTFKNIIDIYIQKKLSDENLFRDDEKKISYKQLIFTKYKDSIDMLSIGGVFVSKEEECKFKDANFAELDFICDNTQMREIKIPILTTKEIQLIENEVVSFSDDLKNILKNEVDKYKKVYRYYPHYVDSNII